MFQFFGWLEDIRIMPYQTSLENAFKRTASVTLICELFRNAYYYLLFTIENKKFWRPLKVILQKQKSWDKSHSISHFRLGAESPSCDGSVAAEPGLAMARGQLHQKALEKQGWGLKPILTGWYLSMEILLVNISFPYNLQTHE